MTPKIEETSWLDFLKGGLEATPELGGSLYIFLGNKMKWYRYDNVPITVFIKNLDFC